MVLEIISSYFQNIGDSIPENYRILFNLLLYTIFIAIYAVFIWRFYKFVANRDIMQLNLRKYNSSKYPGLEKFFAVILYTIEYMIILPFLVLFWFTIFSLFLVLLSKSQSAESILLIAAAIIASIRITAYISEDLSRDIAKIFPFTVLALFLLDPDFFNLESLAVKVSEIPLLFNHILVFVVFIFVIEFVLRGLFSIGELFKSGEEEEESS